MVSTFWSLKPAAAFWFLPDSSPLRSSGWVEETSFTSFTDTVHEPSTTTPLRSALSLCLKAPFFVWKPQKTDERLSQTTSLKRTMKRQELGILFEHKKGPETKLTLAYKALLKNKGEHHCSRALSFLISFLGVCLLANQVHANLIWSCTSSSLTCFSSKKYSKRKVLAHSGSRVFFSFSVLPKSFQFRVARDFMYNMHTGSDLEKRSRFLRFLKQPIHHHSSNAVFLNKTCWIVD